ncbi:hypothetical protein V498_04765 [Pseudogymnoascus sp. VKM F-4517 (FW-2822)]|nr:hypothetical protein V498_04765 [Pseudogymnoascus sp. VKM F-4517 (FW-2822)]
MKLSLATSVLAAALANAVAAPGAAHESERVPVPEGFFESHIGPVDLTLFPAEPLKMASRATTHFYACINDNFRPACNNFELPTNYCYNFQGNWNDAITSIGPDKGTTCILWFDWDCKGRSVSNIISPGIYNLNDFNFNDVASSIKCV